LPRTPWRQVVDRAGGKGDTAAVAVSAAPSGSSRCGTTSSA
jgi:hypothetical protein